MKRIKIPLRTALISINLIILVLPIAGVGIMRLYESALVRQTESALIAQGAFVAASYRSTIARQGTQDFAGLSQSIAQPTANVVAGNWLPRPATLDLATSPVLAPFPDPQALSSDQHKQSIEALRLGGFLNPMLKDAQLTTLAGMRVVDIHGTIIATTGSDLGLSIAATEEIVTALRGTSVSNIRTKEDVYPNTPLDSLSRTSRVRVFVSLPIIMHERIVGAVLLSRTPPSIVQALYAKRQLLIAASGLLLLVVLIMSLLTHRLITRPMNRLVKYAEQISDSPQDASVRLTAGGSPRLRELSRLQDAIVAMAHTLEERAAYLEGFAHHVSHEFKTPLTGIRGAIELLEDHHDSMTPDQFERFVANIKSDTARLSHLTDRLNELTHAEMQNVALEEISLPNLILELAPQFPNIEIEVQDVPSTPVLADAGALATTLETIIGNAQQHSAKQVVFSWSDGCLLIENDGDAISAGNRENIFTPFFTTRREHGGSGLGLTIAQTMMQRTGATLSLDQNTTLTCFRIKFSQS